MLTIDKLESAFSVYIPDLQNVRTSKAYFPVLHMLVNIPDMCAALQHETGTTAPNRYMDWCKAHIATQVMNEADWYALRNSLLHQGSSKTGFGRGRPSQYIDFSFVDPDQAPPGSHQLITGRAEGNNITLDVAALADEMLAAMRRWFDWLLLPENSVAALNVERNLTNLVRVQTKTAIIVTEHRFFNTTSST
jgi:hypothetical protein